MNFKCNPEDLWLSDAFGYFEKFKSHCIHLPMGNLSNLSRDIILGVKKGNRLKHCPCGKIRHFIVHWVAYLDYTYTSISTE
jgi:hypothetical protein